MKKTVSAPFIRGQTNSDSTERTPLLSGEREMNHVADGSLVVDNDVSQVNCGSQHCHPGSLSDFERLRNTT